GSVVHLPVEPDALAAALATRVGLEREVGADLDLDLGLALAGDRLVDPDIDAVGDVLAGGERGVAGAARVAALTAGGRPPAGSAGRLVLRADVEAVETELAAHLVEDTRPAAGERRRGLGQLHALRRRELADAAAEEHARQHLVLRQLGLRGDLQRRLAGAAADHHLRGHVGRGRLGGDVEPRVDLAPAFEGDGPL